MNEIAIGGAAGGSGDRIDAAAPIVASLIARGGPSALTFENLAERTLAFAQLAKRADPDAGFEPQMEMEVEPILADCMAHGIPIVSNFGAANPVGAARRLHALAARMGLRRPRIAVVEGDDLTDVPGLSFKWGADSTSSRFVCANAYIGAFAIAEALKAGAQIVVAGRVADPALTLGPCIAHYGWRRDDLDELAGGTMAGHLIECGAQVTGGYFADPGLKEVPDLHRIGFPIVEVARDGSCVVTKPDGTGGLVDERTVKEQLLYELHDPSAYITPDVVADISDACVARIGPNRVRLSGVRGHVRPSTLKVLAFFEGGWVGEAAISYAGPHAERRARLAMEVIRQRMGPAAKVRFDLIGVTSVHGDDGGHMLARHTAGDAQDVRLRAALGHEDVFEIERLHREFVALWLGGPAGGGGVTTAKRQRLHSNAHFVPREQVTETFRFID